MTFEHEMEEMMLFLGSLTAIPWKCDRSLVIMEGAQYWSCWSNQLCKLKILKFKGPF